MPTIYDGQPLAAKIAALEAELAAAKQQQRDELVQAIAIVVGPGCCFSARDLFEHRLVSPELAAAFADAHIRDARQLGKKLRSLGFEAAGLDEHGARWVCPESGGTLP